MHEVDLPTPRSADRILRRIIPSANTPFFFSDNRIAKEVYSTIIQYNLAKYSTLSCKTFKTHDAIHSSAGRLGHAITRYADPAATIGGSDVRPDLPVALMILNDQYWRKPLDGTALSRVGMIADVHVGGCDGTVKGRGGCLQDGT
jgi:hypothetical protein